MKNFLSVLKLLVVVFMVVFMLNMAVMSIFFDINVLNLPASLPLRIKVLEKNTVEENNLNHAEEFVGMEQFSALEMASNEADAYMTMDEIAFLRHLSLEDMLSAMGILSKLGTEEMNRIYEMSLDGVTFKEFVDIKASVEKKLTSSEVEALNELLCSNKIRYAQKE